MTLASRVYSRRFISAVVNSANSGVAARYTVPANKVAVVRSIDWGTPVVGIAYVAHIGPAGTIWWSNTAGLTAEQTRHWDGDHVFSAGETFGAVWNTGVHLLVVSGFLLDAVN